jgi:hypothetical protein
VIRQRLPHAGEIAVIRDGMLTPLTCNFPHSCRLIPACKENACDDDPPSTFSAAWLINRNGQVTGNSGARVFSSWLTAPFIAPTSD